MIGFPPNPEDGEVYQVSDTLIYQYDASRKCWVRLSGVNNLGLASVNDPGLMSKEDFAKVEDILLPTFDTTITGNTCDGTQFENGRVDLKSTNDDLEVVAALKMYNPDGVIEEQDFVIHNNTMGIDFRINIPRLVEELNNRNSLTYKAVNGEIGDKGERGDPGRDNVESGPVGAKGVDGANAAFLGSIDEDLNESLATNKAVVDVKNDEDNPNKIVVTIGNIGKPDIGPRTVSWKNKNSPWVVGLDKPVFDCGVTEGCSAPSNVIYVDVTSILDKIQDKFQGALDSIKEEKEKAASGFVDSMSRVFADQRQAVCCALESSVSNKINQNIRNIMSNGRYQAAQAGYAFRVTNNSDGEFNRLPEGLPRPNPGRFLPDYDSDSPPSQNVTLSGSLSENPVQYTCDDCYIEVYLDRTNIGKNRSVVIGDVPDGMYVATVIDCCMFHNGTGGSGVFFLQHNNLDPETGEGDSKRVISVRDKGTFPQAVDREQYVGESLSFRHYGGTLELYAPVLPSVGVGNGITICIQPAHCFQGGACVDPNPVICDPDFFVKGNYPGKTLSHRLPEEAGTGLVTYDFFNREARLDVYHPSLRVPENLIASTGEAVGNGVLFFDYEDVENKGDQILVDVTSIELGSEFVYAISCNAEKVQEISNLKVDIPASHVAWYERGFKNESSCGAVVDAGDTRFIVVFKSIGTDCTCGGGEYEETPFIERVKAASAGSQPAIAWPTIDEKNFFGLPQDLSSDIEFEFDRFVSNEIVAKIKTGDVVRYVGDPDTVKKLINVVVLPVVETTI